MKKCFCGNTVPLYRNKHCSTICVKRFWYIKKLKKDNSSFFGNRSKFLKTETGLGFFWEQKVALMLGARHYPFNKYGGDILADIGWVDVKVCNKYKTPRGGFQWVFNRNKKKKEVLWYFCVCLDGKKLVKMLLIPSSQFPKMGATVGSVSKYDKFIYTPDARVL